MLSQPAYKSFVPLPDSHFFQDQPFLLEQLWEGVSYGMFLMEVLAAGQEFRFVAFNPAMEQLSPIPIDHLLGKTLAEAFPAEIAQIYRQHYQIAATTAQSVTLEEAFDQGGQKVSWLLTINPLHNPSITHILVTVTDISDRPTEPPSQTARLLLQQILDEVPIALFWKDRNFVFQGCNRAALVACGLRSTDLMIGKTDYDMPWTAEESDWYRLCDRRVIESGQAEFNIVETQRQADGTQVILNTNKVPLRDETGRVTGILVTIEDITARQAAEAALHSFADQQALINRITAQIRNTLNVTTILKTTIKALSELLEVDWCAFAWYGPMEPAVWQVVEDQSWDGQSWVGQYRASEINEAILRLETQRLDRIDPESEMGYPDFLRTSGARSRLCVPIKTQRDQFGIIICDYRQTEHSWTDDEVVLVQSVAYQLAIAIDQAELYNDSRAKGKALQHTLQELKRAQAQMVQNEKMSSLGQLVAGIAHEINNPVNFIHGNVDYTKVYVADLLKLVEQYQKYYPEPVVEINQAMEAIDLDFLRRDFPKILDSMQLGTARINEIVESLRSFSRLDETGLKVVDLHKGIDSALMILQSRINYPPAIEIVKNYGQMPLVECLAGEINQVFMNILVNAIDALNELAGSETARQIVISTETISPDQVAIRIANNGPAIAIDIQHRIFDPFFTTKPVGQGTGMGMAISYQIITDKHQGQLICHSQRGQGTEFLIQLPIAGSPKENRLCQTKTIPIDQLYPREEK